MASSIVLSSSFVPRNNRVSSSAEYSSKDTSLDSDWTQGDFDQVGDSDVIPDTRPEVSLDGANTLSAKSSAGKRRFFLFSKGFPPSAARRHSRDVLHWASSSKESIHLSPIRHSLQLPPRDSPPHSPFGGMPRVTSNTKHPLLNTRSTLMQRSLSASSSIASPSQDTAFPDLDSISRPSKGSTTATVSTLESNSSGSTQIATPNTEAFRLQDTNNSTREMFQPRSSHDSTDRNRKLALKPEAIPSLLVYLASTKARCQESLSLLT